MLLKIQEYIEKQITPFEESLSRAIGIASVNSEALPLKPFGAEIDAALDMMLELSASFGWRCHKDPEGFYAYSEFGEGEEMIAVLGHLDVVPAGDLSKWESPPFQLDKRGGRYYGRGTQDDKGPLLVAMFAAKALQDAGHSFGKRIRFIFGTDEESLWRGITRYVEDEELPSMAFTPDSSFPLIYAEKGLLQAQLVGPNSSELRLNGGFAFNAVPGNMRYSGPGQDAVCQHLDALGFAYERSEGEINVLGKSVHAQKPEEGINAILRLAMALRAAGQSSKALDFLCELIGEDSSAQKIFGDMSDEHTGKLTFNVGKILLDNEIEQISVDIRIPVLGGSKDEVVRLLSAAAAKYGLEYREYDWLRSIYLPLDTGLIPLFMEVYQEVTGDYQSQPKAAGGATYARAMDNCVTFGMIFPHGVKVEHQPNEYIPVEDVPLAMNIYANAIYRMAQVQ